MYLQQTNMIFPLWDQPSIYIFRGLLFSSEWRLALTLLVISGAEAAITTTTDESHPTRLASHLPKWTLLIYRIQPPHIPHLKSTKWHNGRYMTHFCWFEHFALWDMAGEVDWSWCRLEIHFWICTCRFFLFVYCKLNKYILLTKS